MDNTNQTIRFLQSYPDLVDIFPEPELASKNVPNWYREQPSLINNDDSTYNTGHLHLTVKKCQAFFDSMAAGYILKLPTDLYIDTTDGKLEFVIPAEMQEHYGQLIAHHSTEQVSHYPIDHNIYVNHVLRIHPTWMVQTPEGYSTLYVNPIHQPPLPIKIVEAIIDTDKFWSDGHISFFVHKNFKGVLKQGTPIMQVIPIKRDEWTMELDKTFDPNKTIAQRKSVRSTFQNGYRMKFWQKKVYK